MHTERILISNIEILEKGLSDELNFKYICRFLNKVQNFQLHGRNPDPGFGCSQVMAKKRDGSYGILCVSNGPTGFQTIRNNIFCAISLPTPRRHLIGISSPNHILRTDRPDRNKQDAAIHLRFRLA